MGILYKCYHERLKVINEEILDLNVLSRIDTEDKYPDIGKQIDVLKLQLDDLKKQWEIAKYLEKGVKEEDVR